MKFHIRDIYYYLDNNRYLAHQLSEITIEKLRNIFIDNQLTLFDEKKIKKKLYEKYTYIFKKNNSKLNEDKNLQNKIIEMEELEKFNGLPMTYLDSNDHQPMENHPMEKFCSFCEFCLAPQVQ